MNTLNPKRETIAFESTDMDWAMGEAETLFRESLKAKKLMCQIDPELCAAIVAFFRNRYRRRMDAGGGGRFEPNEGGSNADA